ncbi:helix-turn-helix domain-containing protein [Streptomyces sp. A73]|uniref:PucR family transcriptional regulator n=1 Tax=Streptomyces TaxID=1883 RepID=UPI00160C797C|nr:MULTISPECIES: PucR family transcriptional regulator [unclassified Streptomyces]MBQ0862499.1 helix-turn-helix domain-containing protein [Streptomyces sp. RK75]MBQ1120762.1 helix-turn-helix domain-containing protein [Streptomyces sp. B15]MBQ1158532.1 helix-turn-helix domain-containing protein [Streptomyces sp. A73]
MVQTAAASRARTQPPGPLPQELAAVMWPELPAVAEEMVHEIGHAVPEYRPLLEGSYRTVLLHCVRQNLTSFVELVADPAAPTAERDQLCRRLGQFEAHEGRGLHCLQSALRVGARVGLRRATTVGTRYNLPASLIVAFADAVFAYTDVIESLCREGYVAARGGGDDAWESQRGRLLRLILAGVSDVVTADRVRGAANRAGTSPGPEPSPPSPLTELAGRVGWRIPEQVTLVALAPDAGRNGLRLPGRLDEDILTDLGDQRPHLLVPGEVDEPRAARLESALDGRRAVLGVTVGLGSAADSLRWARQTLSLVESGVLPEAPLTRCEEHLVTLWLTGDPALAERLAVRQLAPLSGLTPGQRERLVDTLRTWLTTRGTAAQMAQVLHLHPQTVRYRMRALKRVLGAQLGDPDQRFATELALRALHLRGRAGVRPPAGAHTKGREPELPRGHEGD